MNDYTLTTIGNKHLYVLGGNGIQVYCSYDVPVGALKDGKLLTTNVRWSATTTKHLGIIHRVCGYSTPTETVNQEVLDDLLKGLIGKNRITDTKPTSLGDKVKTTPDSVKYENHINVKSSEYVVPVYRRRRYR